MRCLAIIVFAGATLLFHCFGECSAEVIYDPTIGTLPENQGWSLRNEPSDNPLPGIVGNALHQTANTNRCVQHWYTSTADLSDSADDVIFIELDLQVVYSNYCTFSDPSRWRAGYGIGITNADDRHWIAAITSNGVRMTNNLSWTEAESSIFYNFDTTGTSNTYRLAIQDDLATLSINGSQVLTMAAGISQSYSATDGWGTSSATFGDLSLSGLSETNLYYVKVGAVAVPEAGTLTLLVLGAVALLPIFRRIKK